jgi:hypothetical protein
MSRNVVVIVAHAALVVAIVVLAALLFTGAGSVPDPESGAYRPDPLFDSLDAWIRGVFALVLLGAAGLVAVGAALWLRTGRIVFGVAMDLSIGLAAFLGLGSRDSSGVAVLALGVVATATLVFGRRSGWAADRPAS